jgi:hypothetical protein
VDYPNRRVDKETRYLHIARKNTPQAPRAIRKGRAAPTTPGSSSVRKRKGKKKVVVVKDKMVDIKVPPQRRALLAEQQAWRSGEEKTDVW